MAFRSLRICAAVGGLATSSGRARNGEYETLFRTPSKPGAEAWLCQMAHTAACRHATSATTAATERIELNTRGGGGKMTGACPLGTVAGLAAAQHLARGDRISSTGGPWLFRGAAGATKFPRRACQRAKAYLVPDFSAATGAGVGGMVGLIQHEWTRALKASVAFWSFCSIWPCRTTQRKLIWTCSPGQPNRS